MRIELAPIRFCRSLRFEHLEARQVLATFTVTSLGDGPVSFPGAAPGTLRQAVYDANHSPGADTIEFTPGLQGTINLSIADDNSLGLSALVISSPIKIQGDTNGITIVRNSAAAEMRLFHVTSAGDLELNSVSVTGGIVRGANGAASSDPGGEARGGAIYNQGTLRIVASTLYGNQAIGGNGGSAAASGSGRGGAIYSDGGSLIVTNATISGNTAQSGTGSTILSSFGGAIYIRNGALAVYNSTITNGAASTGRGIYIIAQNGGSATADIWSSIIAQNDNPIQARDFLTAIDEGSQLTVTGGNNLIRTQGDYQFITVSTDDPLLAPLGDNGGPTMTHELLAGSPAFNLGSNPQNLAVDQRGAPYTRVVGAAADIGAVETQSVAGLLHAGDYNGNHVVDAADYVLWRATLGENVTANSSADGSGNGTVDMADYGVWRSNFGLTEASGSASSTVENVGATLPASMPRLQSNAVAVGPAHNKHPAAVVFRDRASAADLAILDLIASAASHGPQWETSILETDAGRSAQAHGSGQIDKSIWDTWSSVAEVCATEFFD